MADFSPVVSCAEVHDSVNENKTLDDWTATVQLRCAWTDRYALVDDILGNQRPWPYWPYVGGLGMYPRNAATIPESGQYTQDGQGMIYENALVTVQYGLPGKDGQPDPTTLASETLEPTTEFITEDPQNFLWKSDGSTLQEGEQPGRIMRGLRLVRTLYKLASINANLLTLPGSCNSNQYISALLGLTFPIETLLFVPPQLSRTITTDGVGAWNVRLAWEYKESGWNTYYRAKTQAYDSFVIKNDDGTAGGDYEPYPPKNQNPWLP